MATESVAQHGASVEVFAHSLQDPGQRFAGGRFLDAVDGVHHLHPGAHHVPHLAREEHQIQAADRILA
jgi:hypothetical protein